MLALPLPPRRYFFRCDMGSQYARRVRGASTECCCDVCRVDTIASSIGALLIDFNSLLRRIMALREQPKYSSTRVEFKEALDDLTLPRNTIGLFLVYMAPTVRNTEICKDSHHPEAGTVFARYIFSVKKYTQRVLICPKHR